jgi:hypothetical protein
MKTPSSELFALFISSAFLSYFHSRFALLVSSALNVACWFPRSSSPGTKDPFRKLSIVKVDSARGLSKKLSSSSYPLKVCFAPFVEMFPVGSTSAIYYLR